MKTKKKITKYGNTHVIRLYKEELENDNLKEGDLVDFEIKKSKGSKK